MSDFSVVKSYDGVDDGSLCIWNGFWELEREVFDSIFFDYYGYYSFLISKGFEVLSKDNWINLYFVYLLNCFFESSGMLFVDSRSLLVRFDDCFVSDMLKLGIEVKKFSFLDLYFKLCYDFLLSNDSKVLGLFFVFNLCSFLDKDFNSGFFVVFRFLNVNCFRDCLDLSLCYSDFLSLTGDEKERLDSVYGDKVILGSILSFFCYLFKYVNFSDHFLKFFVGLDGFLICNNEDGSDRGLVCSNDSSGVSWFGGEELWFFLYKLFGLWNVKNDNNDDGKNIEVYKLIGFRFFSVIEIWFVILFCFFNIWFIVLQFFFGFFINFDIED